MCGILGAIGTASTGPVAPEGFLRALRRLEHRGPDDEGVWSEGAVTLGHRRLSIIDLSSAGHQPMVSADGRFVLTFNGEIYNYRELRAQLVEQGVAFRSHSDTEVLLALYARLGPACLERLRGMFAFAVWDTREQALFLARDRLGVKPVYYRHHTGGFAFASELRALCALPGAPTEISQEGLQGYLRWGSVPAPSTMVDGVSALMPGTWVRWRHGELEARTYWSIPTEIRPRARGEVIELLRPTLLEAVRLRCLADVPVGAFLSGGIDSSAVVSLMRAGGQQDLRTLSIVFPGTPLDEAEFAATIARRYETRHTSLAVTDAMIAAALDGFSAALDQPTLDGLNTFVVSGLAKQAGLTVALSGLGGDEVFGGYASFRRARMLGPWLDRMPQRLRSLGGVLGSRLSPRLVKLEAFAEPARGSEQTYRATRGVFSSRQTRMLLHQRGGVGCTHAPKLRAAFSSPFHMTMALELGHYMHDQLLRDSDVFGMAHALEIRVPLIDHEVVELVASAPEHVVMGGHPKALLVDALPQPLPRACVERPKMGFTFPFDAWMRSGWRRGIEARLLDPAHPLRAYLRGEALQATWAGFLEGKAHWSRPWSLYALARWLEASVP